MSQGERISDIVVKRAVWWVLTSLVFGILFSEMSLHYLMPLLPVFLAGMMGSAGLMITLKDLFRSGIKPSRISIILSSQFIISASVGFVLALLFFNILTDSPTLALGQVLHGAMPGEQTIPVWIRLAGGNVALGISTLMISTMLSPFVSPALVFSLAGTWIDLDYVMMFASMSVTILPPMLIGSLVRSVKPKSVAKRDNIFSSASVLFALPTTVIVGALAAAFVSVDSFELLLLAALACMAHFAITLAAGWVIPRLLNWELSDVPVSVYHLSMKEFTVTLSVIAATGLDPEVGVPAALYGMMHMAAAPVIARRLYSVRTGRPSPLSG